MAEAHAKDTFEFEVNGTVHSVRDPVRNGRQIRSDAGLVPASNFVLIEVADRSLRSIGLEEDVDLRQDGRSQFRAFEADRVYNFTVNERGFEWGEEHISEADVRLYARISLDEELLLDSDRDKVIHEGDMVNLGGKGVERLISRKKAPKTVKIIVNGREKTVSKGELTFDEIVRLAFENPPTGENVSFTVSYRKGPADRPEGSLLEKQSVKVKEGMIFNVTCTDKS